MKACKTCKYWSEKTVGQDDDIENDSYGERHYCNLLSDKSYEGYEISHKNDAEAAAHGIGGAKIATGPEFGCIHWKENLC